MSSVVKLFLSLLTFGAPLYAIEVTFQADSLQGSLGDIFTFKWDIHKEADEIITPPAFEEQTGAFVILDQSFIPDDELCHYTLKTAIYDSVGTYTFPDFSLYYRSSPQGAQDSILIAGPSVLIYSILSPTDSTFRDIKDIHPYSLPFNWMILLWAFGIIALLLFVYYAYRKYVERKAISEDDPNIIVPPEQAHIVALRELDILKNSDLLKKGKIKAYYSRLSHILRQYFENRYLIDALELTSEELYQRMTVWEGISRETVTVSREVLELADLVKFARYNSSTNESIQSLEKVEALIHKTKVEVTDENERAND